MSLIYYLFYGVGIAATIYILWALYNEISLAHYMKNNPHYTILDESDILMED
jgi:bacteriorhodopsin